VFDWLPARAETPGITHALSSKKAVLATHGSNPLNPLDPLKDQKINDLQIADWRKKEISRAD
jgi:hypothetical protein